MQNATKRANTPEGLEQELLPALKEIDNGSQSIKPSTRVLVVVAASAKRRSHILKAELLLGNTPRRQ
jgi:hypothetical protein